MEAQGADSKGVQGRSPGKLLPRVKQEVSAKREPPTRSGGHKACQRYEQRVGLLVT
jgi:hypothetical protein